MSTIGLPMLTVTGATGGTTEGAYKNDFGISTSLTLEIFISFIESRPKISPIVGIIIRSPLILISGIIVEFVFYNL